MTDDMSIRAAIRNAGHVVNNPALALSQRQKAAVNLLIKLASEKLREVTTK